jgi:hypothetical protein
MVVIVVEGGVVQAVYADKVLCPLDVKVLDLDNAKDADSEVTPAQMRREIQSVEREMQQVF